MTAAEVGLDQNSRLTLERALEIALGYHPTIVAARQEEKKAELNARDALSVYLPTINANASVTHTESEQSAAQAGAAPAANAGSITTQDSYAVGVGLDQLLFDFGRSSASVRQANFGLIAARERARLAEDNVAYQARIAFHDLIAAQEALKVAEDEEGQFESIVELTRLKVEVGRSIESDATKAEADLANAEAKRIQAENAVSSARATLNQAMGLAEEPCWQVVDAPDRDACACVDELMAQAAEHNPEFLALSAEEKVASAGIDYSIADLFPKLTVSGDLSWRGVQFPLTKSWSLGPAITVSLFDGFKNITQVERATADLREARARKAEQEQSLYSSLASAVAGRDTARGQAEAAQWEFETACQSRANVVERYRVGRATILEVTDAELAVTRAGLSASQARADRRKAIALIARLVGEERP